MGSLIKICFLLHILQIRSPLSNNSLAHNGQIGGPDISVDGDMGDDSYTVVIDPDTDFDTAEGDVTLPSIIVDASIDDATVIDCYIDIY